MLVSLLFWGLKLSRSGVAFSEPELTMTVSLRPTLELACEEPRELCAKKKEVLVKYQLFTQQNRWQSILGACD